jgi:Fusaric acid resistance protein-like
MDALDARQRRLAGLARGVRAAVVVPSLFALALLVIKQPQAAGFAVFGTFAHLVMVNYDRGAKARFAEAAMLTLWGALMVSLGTLASAYVCLAVGGAIVVGCLTEIPPLADGRIAVIRTALLLSFMLAVAVPAPARSVFPYLAGWLLAGIVAQSALLLIWVPLAIGPVAQSISSSHDGDSNPSGLADQPWIGKSIGAGLTLGLAVLLTRLLKVDHAFWVVLGVLPVLSATGTSTTRTFWQEQAGTMIGFLVGAVLGKRGVGTTLCWPSAMR